MDFNIILDYCYFLFIIRLVINIKNLNKMYGFYDKDVRIV